MKKLILIIILNFSLHLFAYADQYCDLPKETRTESAQIKARREVCNQLADKSDGESISEQVQPLRTAVDAAKRIRASQGFEQGQFTDSRWGDDGFNFDTNFIAPVEITELNAIITAAGTQDAKAVEMRNDRKFIDDGFTALLEDRSPKRGVDSKILEDFQKSQEALKEAQHKLSEADDADKAAAARKVAEARQALVKSAVEMANNTDNKQVRRSFLGTLRQITDSSERLRENLLVSLNTIEQKAEGIEQKAVSFKSKIAKWYVDTNNEKLPATDRASTLSELIMLNARLIKAEATTIKDNLYQQIQNSILGKYIDEQIGKKCSASSDLSDAAKRLSTLTTKAEAIVCNQDQAAKRQACSNL